MMEQRRRAFLTEPNEPLILARSALTFVQRFQEFGELTGLTGESLATNPLLAIPLPVKSRAAGPRGWPPETNPAAFWNPLFWLPERVAMRYRFDEEPGLDFETEDEWMVRVALETTLNRLYSTTEGTWLDVLSVFDLDVDDPAVQLRISSWLRGADDVTLDGIDLTMLFDGVENPHWALESAAQLLPTLQPACWAIMANDLAQTASDISLEAETLAEARDSVGNLVNLALGTLSEVPSATESEPSPSVRWSEISAIMPTYTGTLDELREGELDELSESFYSIRDDFWACVEVLNEEIDMQRSEALASV